MRFKFRGTRGSIPAPGPDTVRYGGNTTCLEVRSDNGDLIILDAGTGIRSLGLELAASMPLDCHVFISHTHWDHIHGLPFFVPLFVPGNKISIYGPPDPVSMSGIEAVLAKQLEYPHFPVRVAELRAQIKYHTLRDSQVVDLGFATVSTLLMNHPAMNFGFKVECDDRTLFFTGDHEPFHNIYVPGDDGFEDYEEVVRERNEAVVQCLRGVDAFIADAQYTTSEYAHKKGWGHSSMEDALHLARDIGAGATWLTHHETTRTDDEVDAIHRELQRKWASSGLVFNMAREGEFIQV